MDGSDKKATTDLSKEQLEVSKTDIEILKCEMEILELKEQIATSKKKVLETTLKQAEAENIVLEVGLEEKARKLCELKYDKLAEGYASLNLVNRLEEVTTRDFYCQLDAFSNGIYDDKARKSCVGLLESLYRFQRIHMEIHDLYCNMEVALEESVPLSYTPWNKRQMEDAVLDNKRQLFSIKDRFKKHVQRGELCVDALFAEMEDMEDKLSNLGKFLPTARTELKNVDFYKVVDDCLNRM